MFAVIIIALVAFTGCADVSPVCPAEGDHLYGFWGGLWHGLIFVWSFIGSLFSDDIAVYAVNNTGGWYDFGFLLGLGGLGFGGGRARR